MPRPRTSPTIDASASAACRSPCSLRPDVAAALHEVVVAQPPERRRADGGAEGVVRPREPVHEPAVARPCRTPRRCAPRTRTARTRWSCPCPAVRCRAARPSGRRRTSDRSGRTRSSPRRRSRARRGAGRPRRPAASSPRGTAAASVAPATGSAMNAATVSGPVVDHPFELGACQPFRTPSDAAGSRTGTRRRAARAGTVPATACRACGGTPGSTRALRACCRGTAPRRRDHV